VTRHQICLALRATHCLITSETTALEGRYPRPAGTGTASSHGRVAEVAPRQGGAAIPHAAVYIDATNLEDAMYDKILTAPKRPRAPRTSSSAPAAVMTYLAAEYAISWRSTNNFATNADSPRPT
jgi:hypothetical protein